jgi:hypothetical protein
MTEDIGELGRPSRFARKSNVPSKHLRGGRVRASNPPCQRVCV